MDTFIKIPGLQHISEDIFKLLDKKDLLDCRLVTSSWKMILDQPKFWLEKLKSDNILLDDVAQKIWENLVHEVNDDQLKFTYFHSKSIFIIIIFPNIYVCIYIIVLHFYFHQNGYRHHNMLHISEIEIGIASEIACVMRFDNFWYLPKIYIYFNVCI